MDTGDNIPVSGKIDPCGSGSLLYFDRKYIIENVMPDLKVEVFGHGMLVMNISTAKYPLSRWQRFWMKVFFKTKFTKI